MRTFTHLQIKDWRQFALADIELNNQVTVLTGQNGTGKTTLLNILSKHVGWNIQFISTPFWSDKRARQFWSDVNKARSSDLLRNDPIDASHEVGFIRYDDGEECALSTNTLVKAQYQLRYSSQQPVVGLHIPSHRPPSTYYNVTNIPTDPKTAQEHYQDFQQLQFQTYGSSNVQNPGLAQKKSVIAMALFGYGNQAVKANPQYLALFEDFQEILRKIFPAELGFERLEVRIPEVVLVTRSGDFSLDAMSGGINSLFGIAWQIHLYGFGKEACTVTIDEPENHLHPSMQRALLPSLAKAFPDYRFVVATHSPFVVTSHHDSAVYGLRFNKENRVVSGRLGENELAGTPNKIMRDILDVPSNLPIWVEERIKEIISHADPDDPESLATALTEELARLGMTE